MTLIALKMGIDPSSASRAPAGVIADELEDVDPFMACWTKNQAGEPVGYLIQWRQDPAEWIYADADSRRSLDAMM